MKLYWSDVLSPRKACAVAKYLQSPVDYVYLDLERSEHKTPEYLAMNPNGKVPTLVDGALKLWEADAIMCHLASRCDSELWPQDSRQIEVIRWLSWATQHFNSAAGKMYFETIIKPRFKIGPVDTDAVAQATSQFREHAAVLDAHLAAHQWLVDDTLTVADFSTAVTLPYAGEAHIPLDEFPAIQRWHERMNELEAWRDPFPARAAVAA